MQTTDIHPFDLFVLLRDHPQIQEIKVVGHETRHRDFGKDSYDIECDILEVDGKLYVQDTATATKLKPEDLL